MLRATIFRLRTDPIFGSGLLSKWSTTQSSGKSPKACSSLEKMSARGSRSDNAERLVERAIDAYLKTFPMGCSLPFSSDSVVVLDGVDRLVVLRNGKRTLAVYRVSAAGALLPQPRESLPKQFLE
jgi:hypothetical protein